VQVPDLYYREREGFPKAGS